MVVLLINVDRSLQWNSTLYLINVGRIMPHVELVDILIDSERLKIFGIKVIRYLVLLKVLLANSTPLGIVHHILLQVLDALKGFIRIQYALGVIPYKKSGSRN